MNPWNKVNLADYEAHMSADKIQQLQVLNQLMKKQLLRHDIKTVCILGIAGGNGLEHIETDRFDIVYGVDINRDFLHQCGERYKHLTDIMELIHADLSDTEHTTLPDAQLVIADLFVEYIGIGAFAEQISKTNPRYLSVVIQEDGEGSFVSESPFKKKLDCLDSVHHNIDKNILTQALRECGYILIFQETTQLPNLKKLIWLEYELVV